MIKSSIGSTSHNLQLSCKLSMAVHLSSNLFTSSGSPSSVWLKTSQSFVHSQFPSVDSFPVKCLLNGHVLSATLLVSSLTGKVVLFLTAFEKKMLIRLAVRISNFLLSWITLIQIQLINLQQEANDLRFSRSVQDVGWIMIEVSAKVDLQPGHFL